LKKSNVPVDESTKEKRNRGEGGSSRTTQEYTQASPFGGGNKKREKVGIREKLQKPQKGSRKSKKIKRFR